MERTTLIVTFSEDDERPTKQYEWVIPASPDSVVEGVVAALSGRQPEQKNVP